MFLFKKLKSLMNCLYENRFICIEAHFCDLEVSISIHGSPLLTRLRLRNL
jgi:hypothetical protein